MGDVIDLCDSEEEAEQADLVDVTTRANQDKSVFATDKFAFTPCTAASSQEYPLSEDDDIIEILDCSQPEASEAPRLYKSAIAANPYKKDNSAVKSKAPMNPYKKTPTDNSSAARRRSQGDSDDDSDDDSLLDQGPVFASRKTPPSTAPRPAAAASSVQASTAVETASTSAHASETSENRSTPARLSQMSPTSATSDQPFLYPTLLSNSKTYEDVRAKYLLAFWRLARNRVQHSYDGAKLDQTVKKIVCLAFTPHPIRSLEEFCFSGRHRVSDQDRRARDALSAELEEARWNSFQTPPLGPASTRKYYSIAEACLVAMLSEIEQRLQNSDANRWALRQAKTNEEISQVLGEKDLWISLESLIPKIDSLLRTECPGRLTKNNHSDNGVAHYTDPHTVSAEFKQLAVLERRLSIDSEYDEQCGRIKRRSREKKVFYELTSLGYKCAIMMRTRQFPAPPGHYRSSRILTTSEVQTKYQGICLGVDFREGGGGHKVQHEMCNKLDMMKVPYFVGTLDIGDYVFFTNKNDRSYLCPIIVERKSVEDVAQSIHDGRWKRQKKRMYHGQYVFGYNNSRMVFIIEGHDKAQTVTGGYVGHRMFGVDMKQLEDEIENLKSEGFEVIRTPSRENTMFMLARWAAKVADEMRTGKLIAKYTYAEFKGEVRKIPTETDFSRLAKDAMVTRAERQAAAASDAPAAGLKRDTVVIDLDDDDLDETVKASTSLKRQKREKEKEKQPCAYSDWTKTQLQRKCAECGLAKTGSRGELLSRLKGPRPPPLWVERKRKGQYIPPRHNVAATALLVALYLHEIELKRDDGGITKDDLYIKAEGLNITKNPFSGGTTQTGPHHYDGWSSMSTLLDGDPPLVTKKRGRFKLTRNSDIAGFPFAEQIHVWCHQHDNCPCGARAPTYTPAQSSNM